MSSATSEPDYDREAYLEFLAAVQGSLQPREEGSKARPAAEVAAEAAAKRRAEVAQRVAAFKAEHGHCDVHGEYPLNQIDAQGIVRWRPDVCPACAKQDGVRKLMRRAEIDPRFDGCTFDSYETPSDGHRRAKTICEGYALGFKEKLASGASLILSGNPGTGKNHLAVAITKHVLAQGHTALHATAFEVVQRVRETWRKEARETEREVIQQFASVDLLVLDEVGRQAGTDAERLTLFQVIDARYRLRRPTIVISNLDAAGVEAHLGEAATDRLRENGGRMVRFSWASYRRGKGE